MNKNIIYNGESYQTIFVDTENNKTTLLFHKNGKLIESFIFERRLSDKMSDENTLKDLLSNWMEHQTNKSKYNQF